MTASCRPAAGCRISLTILLCALTGVALGDAEDARHWLTRMAMAVEELNYRGTLVHMHDEQAGILHIVHRVEDGQVTERITSMDGPGREIIRNNDEVHCIFPDEKAVLVEPRDVTNRQQSPLQGRLPRLNAVDDRYYALRLGAWQSTTGRPARILVVHPLDHFRYGYQLWLDKATGMPLKSQLRSRDGSVIEQIMFTEIQIQEPIPAEAVQTSLDIATYQWRRVKAAQGNGDSAMNWRATRLPEGFQPIAARLKLAPDARAPTEQLVFTDGLATVSVFIDMGPGSDGEGEGVSSMGAANAYTTMRGAYMITAVGEVPVPTVKMIATHMQPANGGR